MSFPARPAGTVCIRCTKVDAVSSILTIPDGNMPGAMQLTRIPCGISLTCHHQTSLEGMIQLVLS